MNNATVGMKMPSNYVDMSAAELDYEGSFSWTKFFVGVAIAGLVIACGGAVAATVGTVMGTTGLFTGGMFTAVGGGALLVGGIGGAIGTYKSPNDQPSDY